MACPMIGLLQVAPTVVVPQVKLTAPKFGWLVRLKASVFA